MSSVRIKSPDAIEVTKSTTLHCDYYLDSPNEQVYSVLWYWHPSPERHPYLDTFQSANPNEANSQNPVHFFRYLKADPDPDGENHKKAWLGKLRGIFDVKVRKKQKEIPPEV